MHVERRGGHWRGALELALSRGHALCEPVARKKSALYFSRAARCGARLRYDLLRFDVKIDFDTGERGQLELRVDALVREEHQHKGSYAEDVRPQRNISFSGDIQAGEGI